MPGEVKGERTLVAIPRAAWQLPALCDTLPCGVLVLDTAGAILSANQRAHELLGRGPMDLLGHRPALWETLGEDGRELPAHQHPLLTAQRDRVPMRGIVLGLSRPDSQPCWLRLDVTPLTEDDRPASLVVGFLDITEQRLLEDTRAYQALHDPLTGLGNREMLLGRLGRVLQAAERDRSAAALLVMDLNRFKEVNATLGHHLGDQLLQEVAARLLTMVRSSDAVGRLGGDEFAMVLPGTAGDGAAQVARRILAVVDMPCVLEEHSIDVSASIGIALYPEHGTDVTTLVRRADVAMYLAKGSGGGYTIYSPMKDRHNLARLTLLSELRDALAQDYLLLCYQPLLTVPDGEVRAAEALVRWQHPERGLIMPDQFIPLAEHSGLISVLTLWVLETALRQCQGWLAAGQQLGVSVNLSMRTLHDAQLPDTIAWLLQRYRIAPELLTLEITESALMADPPRARQVLDRLAALKVRLAIDDFGTGYSSLGYLKELPVHTIKIDKSFVLGMSADAKDTAIVRSTIDLSHNLGLQVVAEGVEHRTAWDLLAKAGCDAAQGYYLSRPLPAAEFSRWIEAGPARRLWSGGDEAEQRSSP